MASPWIPSQRPATERTWTSVALIGAVMLLSLVLLRLLWSGSGLWFLLVGVILLAAAGYIVVTRRQQTIGYGREVYAAENARTPVILGGAGVVFLAMLLLPNFAGGNGGPPTCWTARARRPSMTNPS